MMRFSGLDLRLSRATAYIEARLRARRPRRDRKRPLEDAHWEWARDWTGNTGHPDGPWDSKAAAVRDWEARWVTHNRGASARADTVVAAKAFGGGHLSLYERLTKVEGSAPCQARTEKIGLPGFLFRRKVPEATSPACPCGRGDQTAAHLFAECTDRRSRSLRAFVYTTNLVIPLKRRYSTV